MKLIKRTTLHFREGTSDKLYEVDLCEVGAGAYVVNFRYGRRGANLKEGAKTVSPVTLAEAEKIAASLLAEKTKKGYREVSAETVNTAAIPVKALKAKGDENARKQAVLLRLQMQLNPPASINVFKKKDAWPLERIIWRAGELQIREAAPLLAQYIGSGNALRDYCIAWALGWCGDAQSVSALGMLAGDTNRPSHVRRIAREALRKLTPLNQGELIQQLPLTLRETAQRGPAARFTEQLQSYLSGGEFERYAVIETIYLLDNEHVRPALLDFVCNAPLRPNAFHYLRQLFKAAEYRRDAEVFGLMAYRFEKNRAMYREWWDNKHQAEPVQYGDNISGPKSSLGTPQSRFAYGDKTRRYLRQRVWRTLRRLGEIGDPAYVKMAVGVLLPFTDADAHEVREETYYRFDEDSWERHSSGKIYWDRFASYVAFNHVLYQNSPRYQLKHNTVAWRCRKGYKPGDAEPPVREEAFPLLWEARPEGLLHLLAESNCQPVHHFAVKALRSCMDFCAQLDVPTVVMLLERPYEITAQLGFELAQKRYQPNAPDLNLTLAVADCLYAPARAAAHQWIAEGRHHFLNASGLLANLVTSAHQDTREFARKLLQSSALRDEVSRTLIVRLISFILTLDKHQEVLAREIAVTLQTCFSQPLRTVGMEVTRDLLDHPLLAAQELGGFILLNHVTPADQLPETVIQSLIASPHDVMRGIGIKLFGQWPDDRLLQNEALLAAFATHELADIRHAIRPVLQRLSQRHPDFAAQMAAQFISALLRREKHEGVHRSLANLLKEDLGNAWHVALDRQTLWQLIHAKSTDAQDLGGYWLNLKIQQDAPWIAEFTTNDIAKLSNHECKSVRDAGQAIFVRLLDRYRHATNPSGAQDELTQALRLLDVDWDDARQFYCRTFDEQFTAAEFTPNLLVSICDSVRPDVQKFGRDLISRYFADADGQEYLLKLSEHPATDLQLFATNYLERYAAGDVNRLRQLRPYFVSVLARVNRARVAKSRVLAFLAAEANKSAEAAQLVAEILTRQSVTMAVGDKAAAIETMLAIRRAHPTIDLPLNVQAVPIKMRQKISA